MSTDLSTDEELTTLGNICQGESVQFFGRLVAMTRAKATELVCSLGGTVVDTHPTLIVLGDEATSKQSEEAAKVAQQSRATLMKEADFVEQLGLVDRESGVKTLYTTSMLAGLVGVSVAAIRRWSRRGHLQTTEQLNRLAYFDFREATVAQRLSQLLLDGKSLELIDRLVDRLHVSFPEVERPLADLPIVVEGGCLLVRDGEELTEPSGQRLLGFDLEDEFETNTQAENNDEETCQAIISLPTVEEPTIDPKQRACELQEEGRLVEAIELWRMGMLDDLVMAEDHFTLAELLFEAGDTAAARERYYAALELDPEYLEARVNLGCLLAENGDLELAIASFRGALEQYEPFSDAHYHLAIALDRIGDRENAEIHWQRFLEISPDSPWAEEAKERLS